MMVENIGFPDYIVDDKLLDEEYKDVSIKSSFQNKFSLLLIRERIWHFYPLLTSGFITQW